ncbi:hypothetical protein MNBD_GAMMA23-2441 [hydrothermal vent metagenome]|uniref:Outer membrane lipoprotein carrier protein LolA n=1 Tax=hydrothermal vent metagenome TaxID=652676 RepID=A0A3B0ZGI1_9ZZZZ
MMKTNKISQALLWITLGALFHSMVTADNKGLSLVMEKLSAIQRTTAEFTEIKTYSLLNEQIKLSGQLEYVAPDTLIKKTIKPEAEYFEVTGDALTIKKLDGEEHNLLLSNYPLIEIFVEAYRGVLSGNLKKLKQYYGVEFIETSQLGGVNNEAFWTIKLTPTDEEALEYIDVIIVDGVGGAVNKVTTMESGGDKSVLSIDTLASKK